MTFRICDKCPIPHYENCPDCFGYGIYPGEVEPVVPISAGKAFDKTYPANWQPCPTCGSGPEGLPAAIAEAFKFAETLPEPSFAGLPIKAANPQDLADTLQHQAQAETTRKALVKTLFNRAGLDRLRGITDTEWSAAEERDDA